MRATAITMAALFGLGLSACAPQPVLPPEQTAAAACEARGGKMTPVGRMQSLQCVIDYADAGKACRSGADCQGDCRVDGPVAVPAGREVTGVCAANSSRFGCHTTIENGRAQATLCVD